MGIEQMHVGQLALLQSGFQVLLAIDDGFFSGVSLKGVIKKLHSSEMRWSRCPAQRIRRRITLEDTHLNYNQTADFVPDHFDSHFVTHPWRIWKRNIMVRTAGSAQNRHVSAFDKAKIALALDIPAASNVGNNFC